MLEPFFLLWEIISMNCTEKLLNKQNWHFGVLQSNSSNYFLTCEKNNTIQDLERQVPLPSDFDRKLYILQLYT